MKTFKLIGLILLATSLTPICGYASEIPRNRLPTSLRLDLLEATLRYRLRGQPLAREAICYLYVNEGLGKGLEKRLTDCRILVRSGDVGSNPPKERWYWFDIGKVTEHEAFISVQDAKSFTVVRLRRARARWIVVSESPFYVT